jgi:hypothetical protein
MGSPTPGFGATSPLGTAPPGSPGIPRAPRSSRRPDSIRRRLAQIGAGNGTTRLAMGSPSLGISGSSTNFDGGGLGCKRERAAPAQAVLHRRLQRRPRLRAPPPRPEFRWAPSRSVTQGSAVASRSDPQPKSFDDGPCSTTGFSPSSRRGDLCLAPSGRLGRLRPGTGCGVHRRGGIWCICPTRRSRRCCLLIALR